MANNFISVTADDLGTTPVDIYTTPAATSTIGIGMTAANKLGNNIFFTASIIKDGTAIETRLVDNAPIPTGSSLEVIGRGGKTVLQAGDVLRVVASEATSCDVVLSILEIT